MRSLKSAEISGLLGRFNHTFEIDDEWKFVILHGPNGVGKTRFLEAVEAALKGHVGKLMRIPFSRLQFGFSDSTKFWIERVGDERLGLGEQFDETDGASKLHFSLSFGDEPQIWVVGPEDIAGRDRTAIREIERQLPVERYGPDSWLDHRQGDVVSTFEILDRYADVLDRNETRFFMQRPPEFSEFFKSQSVHLIETQRLLRFVETSPLRAGAVKRGSVAKRSTVDEFAQDLSGAFEKRLPPTRVFHNNSTELSRGGYLHRTRPR